MSARSLSLKSPVVIAVVLVLLAAVVVLNIRTFGSGRHEHGAGSAARAQAYPVLPGDLGELVRLAGQDLRNERPADVTDATSPANPRRDPFRDGKAVVKSPPRAESRRPSRTHSKRKPVPPCSAVLLGGPRPLALIGSKTLGLGDRTADATIVEIGTGGVVLQDKDGHRRTLIVGGSVASGSFSIRVGGKDPLAAVESERKEP